MLSISPHKWNGKCVFSVNIRCTFCFLINGGNIQGPTLKSVEYSFNQGQANEISDMQPFITDGTINKNQQTKSLRKEKCASDDQLWQICFQENIKTT